MQALEEVDTEEYRFADRHTAARAWAIAADLCDGNPTLRIASVVNEERIPLLIVHDPTTDQRIQFDMVAWILFADHDGRLHTLYWDQVFAMSHSDVVEHIRNVAGLCPYGYAQFPLSLPHVRTYQTVAALLRSGVHDRDGWQIRQVTASPHDPANTDHDLLDLFYGSDHLWTVLVNDLHHQIDNGATRYLEPVWCLYRGLEPIALANTIDGTWYTRHHAIVTTAISIRAALADILAATFELPIAEPRRLRRPRPSAREKTAQRLDMEEESR